MTTATRTRKASKPEEKTVQFLNRYLIKATGSIVWHVRNGEDKEYCVTINANGTTGCYNKLTGEECKGHKYAHRAGHECHHIVACQQRESERTDALALAWLRNELAPDADAVESLEYVREELDDAKYEAWKAALNLNSMTREQHIRAFDPNYESRW